MTKRILNKEKAPGIGRWDRSQILKVKVPSEGLKSLYWDHGKSVVEIAKFINIKPVTLYSHMYRNGITLRPQKKSMKKGSDSPNWRGGIMTLHGYLRYSSGKYEGQLVHRRIAEKIIGRPLTRDEDVHHVNGKRDDNRKSNLLICSRSFHMFLHRKMDLKNNKPLFGRS